MQIVINSIYKVIEPTEKSKISSAYNIIMMITIIVSLVPLLFKESNFAFQIIDKVTVSIFIVDYFLRLVTAEKKLGKGKKSFFIYPFTPMAIIDIISILPSFNILNSGLRTLKVLRMARTFRVLKIVRYSKNIRIIINVISKQKPALLTVAALAIGYIFVCALIIFNLEPNTFDSFFDAVYWATISLTTVGYGDIYAISNVGKVLTMISSFLGIAIVALPAGIITAGYMEELNNGE